MRTLSTFLLLLAIAVGPAAAGVSFTHVYDLADFTGTIRFGYVRVAMDQNQNETYVVEGNVVRVFNDAGMEVHRFSQDPQFGSLFSVTVDDAGDIYTLSYETGVDNPRWIVNRCNYRGEPRETLEVRGMPDSVAQFNPNQIFLREGRILLVNRFGMRAVEIDRTGAFVKDWDFGRLAEVDDNARPDTEISGFTVDQTGNMLFTVPVMFRAFVVSPDGAVRTFGKAASAPGGFGIVSGIAVGPRGEVVVADKLRARVMVFDQDLKFVGEFGGTPADPLVRPADVSVDGAGRVYVSQGRGKGVSVYTVELN